MRLRPDTRPRSVFTLPVCERGMFSGMQNQAGADKAPRQDELPAGWSRHGDWLVQRAVLRRQDQEWWWTKVAAGWMRCCDRFDYPTNFESYEVSSWRWVPTRRDWGYAIVYWAKRDDDAPIGTVKYNRRSPLHRALWDTTEALGVVQHWPMTDRPLTAPECEDEARLLNSRRSEDSCVYLSLYHLAKRRTTKDWLLSLPRWGPAVGDQIEELCRGWVAREQRPINLETVRAEKPGATAGSAMCDKRFIPLGSDGAGADTLLILKMSPPGYPARGHAVPVHGMMPFPEFGFPGAMAFIGRRGGDAAAVLVPHISRREDAVYPDEPAPKPKDKGKGKAQKKNKWQVVPEKAGVLGPALDLFGLDEPMPGRAPQVDEATSSPEVDEATSSPPPRKPTRDETVLCLEESVFRDILIGEEVEAWNAIDPEMMQCVDCNSWCIAEGDDAALKNLCKDCKKRRRKREADPLDQHGPGRARGVVQSTARAMIQRGQQEARAEALAGARVPPVTKDRWLLCQEAEVDVPAMATQTSCSTEDTTTQTKMERYRWLQDCGKNMLPIFSGMIMQEQIVVDWRSDWWYDTGKEYGCADWLTGLVYRSDLASATLDQFQKWGSRTFYLPVRARDGLKFTTNGIVSDGSRSAQTFQAGSILAARFHKYVAREVIVELQGVELTVLKLVKLDSGSLISAIAPRNWFAGTARLLSFDPTAGRMDRKVFNACKWQGAAKTEKSPLAQGFIQIARAQELGKNIPADPDNVVPILRELAKGYEVPVDVSGPFKWGFCYSGCGRERPGKFHGRICPECNGKNTVLGRWMEDGYEICSAANPVRYPGVVHTRKQHPKIKKDAVTVGKYGIDYVVTKKVNGKEVVVTEDEIERSPINQGPGSRLGGIGLDAAIPFVSAGGIRPLVEAVKYRVFKALPGRKVDPDAYIRATQLLDTMLPLLTRHEVVKRAEGLFLDMLEWVNTMNCGRRRRALMRALIELRANNYLAPQDWKLIKPFVKTENLPYFKAMSDWQFGKIVSRSGFEYVPRLIQAPSDYSHLIAGPYLKPMVHGLKADWSADNWLFYASVEPAKLDKWLKRITDCQSYFWSDYSAFDATYSPEAWAMLETLYRRCMPEASAELWRVLEAWRTPTAKVTQRQNGYTLKYQARVCNASGRDDTALANATLNGMVLGLSFAAALSGVDITELQPEHIEGCKEKVRIAIVGDDSLVGCYFDVEAYKERILSNIKRFGLIAKVESSNWIGDVTFLGMMPYPTRKGLQWGPTIGRRAYKAFWQADPIGSLPAWTRGVAQQLILCRNVPILYEMAQQVDWLLQGHKVTKQAVDRNRIWSSRVESADHYSMDCFDWLARRYETVGVTAQMFKRDIGIIRSIERLPAVVQLESVSRIILHDDL